MGLELGGSSSRSSGRFATKTTWTATVLSILSQRRIWVGFIACITLITLLRQSYVSRERFFGTDVVALNGGDTSDNEEQEMTTGTEEGPETKVKEKEKRVEAVYNATLGFGEVFMPVMPQYVIFDF